MIKLTVTATNHTVTLQDPRPITQNNEEQAVISVEAGTSKGISMQWGQFERLAKQLTDLASLGMCTFIVESTEDLRFTSQSDAPSNPMIDLITGSIVGAVGVTDATITGVNLLGGQARTGLSVSGNAGTGKLVFTALEPGYPSTEITVTIVDSGEDGLAVDHTGAALTIDLGGATPALSAVVTAVNTEMEGSLVAVAYGTDSDTLTSAQLMPATNFIPLADLKIAGAGGTGTIVLLAFTPTFPASTIKVEIIDSGTAGLAVTYTNKKLTINLGDTTPTVTNTITAINTVTGGEVTANLSGSGADTITSTLALTSLIGGDGGTGWSLVVGGVPATITAVDVDTPTAETITFSVGEVGSESDVAKVLLRSNEKITDASVVLAEAT